MKKLTEKDLLEELERLTRIISFEIIEESEKPFFKKSLQQCLTALAKYRADKIARADLRKREREASKLTRFYSKEKTACKNQLQF